jgi:hypothetical protein
VGGLQKLRQRRSLGFVQLRRALSGGWVGWVQSPRITKTRILWSGKEWRFRNRRNREYLDLTDNTPNDVRGRKKSLSIIKAKARQDAPGR